MHATTQQLIQLRDGAPIEAGVAEHVELCESCSREFRLIRERKRALQELPQLAPSSGAFERLSERLASEQALAERERRGLLPLRWAVAAALVAALALWLIPGDPGDRMTRVAQSDIPTTADARSERQLVTDAQLRLRDELMDRSSTLESVAEQLALLGGREPSMSTSEALAALEAQLALVDYNLSAAQIDQYKPAEMNTLLARRVDTLELIVGVQRAELARQGYHGFQVMTAANFEEDQPW